MDRMEDYLLSHRKNIDEQMQYANLSVKSVTGAGKDVDKGVARGRLQGK
jgi:hypothetical protein